MAGEHPEGTVVFNTMLIFFKISAWAEQSYLQN